MDALRWWADRHPVAAAVVPTLLAIGLLLASSIAAAGEVTIGLPQFKDGRTALLSCVEIVSEAVTTTAPEPWGPATRWTTVRGSQRTEACPPQEFINMIRVPTERWRSYRITVRLRIVAADGTVLSDRVLPPYFRFDNGHEPAAPVLFDSA